MQNIAISCQCVRFEEYMKGDQKTKFSEIYLGQLSTNFALIQEILQWNFM